MMKIGGIAFMMVAYLCFSILELGHGVVNRVRSTFIYLQIIKGQPQYNKIETAINWPEMQDTLIPAWSMRPLDRPNLGNNTWR